MKVKTPEDMKKMVAEGSDVLKRFVKAFIDHDKPLIGLINGPAVGISVTVLAMFDLVIASDRVSMRLSVLKDKFRPLSILHLLLLANQLKAVQLTLSHCLWEYLK